MNKSFNRALIYIIRKPLKSILLFLIIAVTTLLIMIGVSIKNSSLREAATLRTSLGSSFGIVIDKSKSANFQSDVESGSGVKYIGDILNKDVVNHISDNEQIIDYNINVNGQAFLKENETAYLKLVETNDNYKDDEILKHTISFEANSDAEKSTLFQNGKLDLLDGKYIDKDEKNVAMISSELAQLNNLSINDTLYLSDIEHSEIITPLKVIGIFQVKEMQMSAASAPPASSYYNRVFTDVESMNQFFKESGYSRVDFQVKDPAQMDELIKVLQKDTRIPWDSFSIDKNDVNYQKAVKPLHEMSNLVDIFLFITLLSCALILSMVLSMWMKSRVYEIGVFISAGISKQSVLFQHLIEVVLISWLSFLCAISTGVILCNTLIPTIFDESINISISINECILSIFVITAVICISVLLSNSIVLRLKPKKILSKMS